MLKSRFSWDDDPTLRYFAISKDSELLGVYDAKQKKELIPCEYKSFIDSWFCFKIGVMQANKNERWGLLSLETGEVLIPFEYNLKSVKNIYKKHNKESVQTTEYSMYYIVEKNGKKGMFDHTGRMLIPCKFDEIEFIEHKNYFLVKEFHLFGAVEDETFEEILPVEFDKIYKGTRKITNEQTGDEVIVEAYYVEQKTENGLRKGVYTKINGLVWF